MSLNLVNTGQAAGDGSGDPARTAFQKINSNFLYLETLLNNAAAPIEKKYDTNADLVADQSNHVAGLIYWVIDARTDSEITAGDPVYFAFYRYDGTTNNSINDYTALTDDEVSSVISQTGIGVKTVQDIQLSYPNYDSLDFGKVYAVRDSGNNILGFVFDREYSKYLIGFEALKASNTFYFKIKNKTNSAALIVEITNFIAVGPRYQVTVASGLTTTDVRLNDVLDFDLPDMDNSGGSSLYLGQFTSLMALETAYPAASANPGEWAIIDSQGTDARKALLDVTENIWLFGDVVGGDMDSATYDPAGKSEQILTVGDLLDEDNLASNSATKAASQQSVKAYIDSRKQEKINGTRLVNSNASGSFTLDLDAYVKWKFTLTGPVDFTFSNLPAGDAVKDVEIMIDGVQAITWNDTILFDPDSDTYDGAKYNRYVFTIENDEIRGFRKNLEDV
jgi:hypothetical protein